MTFSIVRSNEIKNGSVVSLVHAHVSKIYRSNKKKRVLNHLRHEHVWDNNTWLAQVISDVIWSLCIAQTQVSSTENVKSERHKHTIFVSSYHAFIYYVLHSQKIKVNVCQNRAEQSSSCVYFFVLFVWKSSDAYFRSQTFCIFFLLCLLTYYYLCLFCFVRIYVSYMQIKQC